MQIIIDIPDKIKETIDSGQGERAHNIPLWLCYSIANGTPLGKIRAEIECKANSGQWSEAVVYGMKKSIIIIDKYRESEG